MSDRDSTQPMKAEQNRMQEPPLFKMTGELFTWTSASVSNVGCVRSINEDSFLELPDKGIWLVADGMGGHEAGDVASRMIADRVRNVQYSDNFGVLIDNIEDCLIAAHESLTHFGYERGKIAGSTVVGMVAHRSHCLFLWAGDSRAYLLRNNKFQQTTRDHSVVEELLESGNISAEEAQHHPDANVITRAVGAGNVLYLDMDVMAVEHGDLFLLCSDGLYKEINSQEMNLILHRYYSPAKIAQELVGLALTRGARDNVTVIVIRVSK